MRCFLNFFKSKPPSSDTAYVGITDTAFDEALKSEIREVEAYAAELAKSLQKQFEKEFEKKNRKNLRVGLERTIDGDEVEGISSDHVFEKEYCSFMAVEYDNFDDDDRYEDIDIPLWYYFGGYWHGTGTLYQAAYDNLEKEMEEALKKLLNRF